MPAEPDPLRPLARRDPEPAFSEPWQTGALALAVCLVERNVIGARQWAEALGAALRDQAAAAAPDTVETYYLAVLRALERVLDDRGLVGADALARRTAAWRRAYLGTPHGRPVELEPAGDPER